MDFYKGSGLSVLLMTLGVGRMGRRGEKKPTLKQRHEKPEHCQKLTPWGFPGGSVVKSLPAKQETRIRSLENEDPLEKEMATHSSILAWGIPWTEEPGGNSPWGHKESDRT